MSTSPPSSSDLPSPRGSTPLPPEPELRGVRRVQQPTSGDVAAHVRSEGPVIPVDRNALAVERWAIAVGRLDAEVIGEAERLDLQQRNDIVEAIRRVPEKATSPWVQWLQRLVRRFRGDKGESPPIPQPR